MERRQKGQSSGSGDDDGEGIYQVLRVIIRPFRHLL